MLGSAQAVTHGIEMTALTCLIKGIADAANRLFNASFSQMLDLTSQRVLPPRPLLVHGSWSYNAANNVCLHNVKEAIVVMEQPTFIWI